MSAGQHPLLVSRHGLGQELEGSASNFPSARSTRAPEADPNTPGAPSLMAGTARIRTLSAIAALATLLALVPLAGTTPAMAGPVADNPETYALCGRVFPDPLAYWVPPLGEDTPYPGVGSPFAKGNAECAAKTFISYDEAIRGLSFMADELPGVSDYVDLIDLSRTDEFDDVLREELGDGYSEGNGGELGERRELPLYMVRVTAPDAADNPIDDRAHFVWSLSVHGIEAAGREGGIRAIEDLATWAANEPDRLLLETAGETITTMGGREARNLPVSEVMEASVSYFVLPNPDGWRRGDLDQGNTAFQRFNGNGMDLNRDWPEIGYTDPSFTPWSESESRTFGKALQAVSDEWAGGIDLHGMVEANAFSYTLLGGSQREYDENERIMEFVEQAYVDAESRLQWSPIIKPNDAPEQCVEFAGVTPNGDTHLPPGEDCDMRSYGVQYGTIWDTIEYTATGALGNWIDSPIGLDADGIDNEMMLSHLGNCGVGTCFVPEAEQLHVDGNKGLIYAMLNFELDPVIGEFDLDGTNVGYLVNPRRLVDPGVELKPAPADALDRPDAAGTAQTSFGDTVLVEFSIDNDGDGLGAQGEALTDPTAGQYYVAGISGSTRYQAVTEQSVHLADTNVQYQNPGNGQWMSRPTYGSDGAVYRVSGDHSDWNYPLDGNYRFIANTLQPMRISYELEFSTDPVWEDPIQAAYDVSNMDFFTELEPFLADGTTLTALNVDEVLSGERDLADFDTVIAVDGAFLPGYVTDYDLYETYSQGLLDLPATDYTHADATAMGAKLEDFASAGGNVVLTDDAVQAVAWMNIGLTLDDVGIRGSYAGNAVFSGGYDHPLAAGTNNPGAAEGAGGRRQTAEPLPIGYSIEDGEDNMPSWGVIAGAVSAAGGEVVTTTDGDDNLASIATIPVGAGQVRTFGSVLTFPTTAYFHPSGLSSYGLTDHGYTLLDNLMTWDNPAQSAAPDLDDDAIGWVASDIPTRIMVDGTESLPTAFIASGI